MSCAGIIPLLSNSSIPPPAPRSLVSPPHYRCMKSCYVCVDLCGYIFIFFVVDSRSSVAVVNCADYPDLCSLYSITHYPTVLLFRASPNDWVPCNGVMDSRVILRLLQNTVNEKDGLVRIHIHTHCMYKYLYDIVNKCVYIIDIHIYMTLYMYMYMYI